MVSRMVRFGAKYLFIAVMALSLVGFGTGCSSDEGLAAKCKDFSITEQEVTDYTAAYRAQNGYTDDTEWARYLVSQSITSTSTWREEAIRTLAQRKIVENRAKELGITADESTVNQTITYMKQAYGIESDEDWSAYLADLGMTPEQYRENCEFASVEQQVLSADLNLSTDENDAQVNEYIKENLGDRVTRKFSVITFTDESAANAALAELQDLTGDALSTRFNQTVDEQSSNGAYSGDLGWDLAYSTEEAIDGNDKIKLQSGDLYKKVVAGDGIWQIYLCTGRFAFTSDAAYADITDQELKNLIDSAAISSLLSDEADDYLNQKVNEASIDVYQMPDGLPYDVDDIISQISHK